MIWIDYKDATPIYEQIVNRFKNLIVSGVLSTDDKMPSVRNLAMELSINPNTIQKAYGELDSMGVICSVPGKGCFVSENARELLRQKEYEKLKEIQPLVLSMALAGVERGDVLACVEQAYEAAKQMGGNGTDD